MKNVIIRNETANIVLLLVAENEDDITVTMLNRCPLITDSNEYAKAVPSEKEASIKLLR